MSRNSLLEAGAKSEGYELSGCGFERLRVRVQLQSLNEACVQKQSSRSVLRKGFIVITLQHGCSPVNMLDIFRTPLLKGTSGGLLLHVEPSKTSMMEIFCE